MANHKFSNSTAHEGRSSATDTLRQGASELRHQAESIAHDVREAGKERFAQARETVQEAGSHLQEAAREKAGQVRDTAQEYYQAGRDQMCGMEKNLESRIRENPVTSLCIAAGLGLLVGIVWARR